MQYDNILRNIRRYVLLTPAQEEAFCDLLTIETIKRKELLLREGDVCTDEYFVNKGCLRQYFIDKKGLEHNLYFAIEDWWISDLYSRTQMAPSYCNIIALEDSVLVKINHQSLEKFMTQVPAMERFFRLSYEQSMVSQHLKNLQMLYMSAEERYVYFRERFPALANRIPQKHIASFLGLTPQFFNTIHAKVLRSK
ncbi:Crp/Fnr family transcriptional regulator [Chitinophaga pinensis]|uniref:Transcriptional regulator, Crp/Fnr family n=1 Tax=Chitinophaga pinensis (strain ATCC 43595 / DSM 2588 / LMG 13176 / NBRC 15968 / NCIMB 11800 / UQM 2034) TaxID=485918 RepID=A0A979G774_CHIPD|nr:Crp/Fnr family transcriptional regulator [Chitinophaga pinensis]ACU62070.1 putative transcriptional regulator, Crp/Fnr family [Chitinophaga pinensis DSM 2588]